MKTTPSLKGNNNKKIILSLLPANRHAAISDDAYYRSARENAKLSSTSPNFTTRYPRHPSRRYLIKSSASRWIWLLFPAITAFRYFGLGGSRFMTILFLERSMANSGVVIVQGRRSDALVLCSRAVGAVL